MGGGEPVETVADAAPLLFAGLSFVLDSCLTYKEKQPIVDIIKKQGGQIQHSLSKKVLEPFV